MPELFGTRYTRAELHRRVGRVEQVAGVRLVTIGDGLARGVRVLEFRTGTGFAFDVLVDRSFDVGRCELGGRPLSWLSGAGVVGPWYYEPDGWGWFRAWGGGDRKGTRLNSSHLGISPPSPSPPPFRSGDGLARGVRVLEFRTGTGFAFDVLVDRSFDVGRCELGGRPLSWLSGAGVVGPWYYEPDGWGWFRAWGG